jgi:general secretion pathway protein K
MKMPPRRTKARGAALLMAMIIVALVATLASAMVWQQWRTVQIETAERARAQSSWILTGALDWSQLILREDARADNNKQTNNNSIPYDGLDEPWATPLAEARLSTFLAADENYTGDGPEAFLSGDIADAQARFNVLNLIEEDPTTGNPKISLTWLKALQDLCDQIDVSRATATTIANGLLDAKGINTPIEKPNPPLMPARIDQLSWFGVDPAALKRLEPFLVLIDPATTTNAGKLPILVNANTASPEVIASVLGVNIGDAQALVQSRKNKPLRDQKGIKDLLSLSTTAEQNLNLIKYRSNFFEVRGRMRIGDRVLEQKALVFRESARKTTVMRREDIALKDPGT